MSKRIFTTTGMPVSVYELFLTPAAAEGPPGPPRHATAPRSPHTAAQGVIRERSGANSQLGERGVWKGALPGTGLIGPRYGGGS